MKKSLLLLPAILLLSCAPNKTNSIKLGVEQTVKIPVEYVSVMASIQMEDTDPVSVEREGYEKLAEAVGLLNDIGYEKDHLEVNSGEVQNRSYNQRKSYQFTSSINFDIYDLDQIDTIRRALIAEGVNNFRITAYKNSQADSLYDQAYHQAIQKAKDKAQKLIQNEDVTIGEIRNLSENVKETVEIVTTAFQSKSVSIDLDAELSMDPVVPLFNKEYYNRSIEFAIEFALE